MIKLRERANWYEDVLRTWSVELISKRIGPAYHLFEAQKSLAAPFQRKDFK